ncbi:MAG: ArsR family transcriptional regulator [Saprospiraceae bacterium]|nr:ArsR family transcriptional regulator [Saprospiraceae bacterium]
MIEALISSKTRIKLLLKFFLNSNNKAYLRSLESEFGESTNAIRVELNRFEDAGMLSSYTSGNRKYFQANTKHPLYQEVNSILRKQLGIDQIIENIIERLGEVEKVFITGALAKGLDSSIIDLVIIGHVNKEYLISLIEKAEKLISRKIRYMVYTADDITAEHDIINEQNALLIWEFDK